MKDGQPILAFSAIGSGKLMRTVSNVIGVLDFDLTPQEAINLPAYGTYNHAKSAQTFGVGELDQELKAKVNAMGLKIEESNVTRGYWIGIQIDRSTGTLHGGATRAFGAGFDGIAVGY